ncbi:helix-turn-helix domain-containing protein [uncultured Cellulomonas sp.]|uniref:helix-turn-helix domain-containing protein n=1 Tax=uncultured Cellulomonas sp. TaxID=189682 RepID=UPI0028F14CE0|nr:helix-turn-helix domain-containing protein [uncultured Cellulomonas sp.]
MTTSPIDVQPTEFISVADVAAELRVTQRFVRRLIADGELHAVKIGSRLVRIRRDDLEAILRPVPVHRPNSLKP